MEYKFTVVQNFHERHCCHEYENTTIHQSIDKDEIKQLLMCPL